ncbi:MAG TPA: 16S rRNA (cytidine(1402)-2'-O)-methyltransferase [Candidatus Acidoferrales bacterium]|nr:16S rRNA (cytidine(1402)-2'-O)-methyltransferase [Candidatus Acidoferrales bacterium]
MTPTKRTVTLPAPEAESSSKTCSGCLYVVATPIGNLEDISMRALRILKEADLIACEDTRQTMKLLSHFDIHTKLMSYHEHNELTRSPEIVIDLEQGASVALVSDAGTPAISDPGQRLVSLCLRHGIKVVPVPGPSAFVAALAASGLPAEEFTFIGFLPARATQRRKTLRELASEPRTLTFYEAPHRLLDSLEDMLEILGNRPTVIAREISKIHEEFQHGHLLDLVEVVRKKAPRGEITVLIGTADGAPLHIQNGQAATNIANIVPLAKRVDQLMSEQNLDRKAALKQAARERGLTRREAYKQLLITRDE